jgi:SAM-dependent methyltransferase
MNRTSAGTRVLMAALDRSYVPAHRLLVRHTHAYQRLFDELRETAREHVASGGRGLLVPSSTGDVLRRMAPLATQWWCVDQNPACLDACREVLPTVTTREADLDAGWPLPLDLSFDLVLCVHALHFLDRPEAFLRAVARTLSPSGVALWVVLGVPNTGRRAGAWADIERIRSRHGLREVGNFLPWMAGDAVMRRVARRPLRAWDPTTLSRFFTASGHDVVTVTPTFHEHSLLVVTRASPIQGDSP